MALSHEERELITGLFERMQESGAPDKDPEAEALINQLARRTPDALYILVQTALIQEAQLEDSDAQLEDMQARIDELEQQLSGGRPQARSGGGGFLGGARRQANVGRDEYEPAPRGGSSVPPIGSRGSASTYDSGRPSPQWSGRSPEPMGRTAQPMGRSPMGAPPQSPQQAQAGGGGGFLKTAAAMAAGVAGGALLGNALGGMFGGGGNKGGEAQAGQAGESSQGNEPTYQNADDNDPGNTDSSWHDASTEGGDWGVGGDDMEI